MRHYGLKCFLRWVIAFAVPLACMFAGTRFLAPALYPGRACLPVFSEAPVWLGDLFSSGCEKAAEYTGLFACGATLLLALAWRAGVPARCEFARACRRAMLLGRFMLIVTVAVSAFCVYVMYRCCVPAGGVFAPDMIPCYFVIFPLLPFSFRFVLRFAAPASISGRHGYFKRF